MSKKSYDIREEKLKMPIRYRIASFAAERLRSPSLRAIEAEARQALVDVIMRDVETIPASDIKVLRRYRFVREAVHIELPQYLSNVPDGEPREVELPNGNVVVRPPKKRFVYGPCRDDVDLPTFNSWRRAMQIKVERPDGFYRPILLTLPRKISLPDGDFPDVNFVEIRATQMNQESNGNLVVRGIRSNWMSQEIKEKLVAYYLAGDARILTERRLIVAMIQMINTCNTFGQMLEIWPEVEEIKDQLFNPSTPLARSLVTLSDDDRALVCSNLSERGVKSTLCRAA